ncbi:MAG: hypothetical protein PX636_10600, partial [Microcystis sp. M53598_WE2]|nr:hypothetical protein [Microcystis sp. M53598_WE2]
MASLLLCLVVSGLPSSIIPSSNGGDNLAIFKETGDRRQEIISIYSSDTPHPTPYTPHPTPHFPNTPLPHYPTPHTPHPTS